LPADLGTNPEDRDLIEFIKIILKACRTRPVMRFRSAEELMTALLSFQFNASHRHREHIRRFRAKLIGLGGLLVGLGVVALLIYRLVLLLQGH
jgi:hypothetical protein